MKEEKEKEKEKEEEEEMLITYPTSCSEQSRGEEDATIRLAFKMILSCIKVERQEIIITAISLLHFGLRSFDGERVYEKKENKRWTSYLLVIIFFFS